MPNSANKELKEAEAPIRPCILTAKGPTVDIRFGISVHITTITPKRRLDRQSACLRLTSSLPFPLKMVTVLAAEGVRHRACACLKWPGSLCPFALRLPDCCYLVSHGTRSLQFTRRGEDVRQTRTQTHTRAHAHARTHTHQTRSRGREEGEKSVAICGKHKCASQKCVCACVCVDSSSSNLE